MINPRGFGSDNHSGAHPKILEAILTANQGHAPSYGTDEITKNCLQIIKNNFGTATEAFFVFNGTAANVLCLRAGLQSYESYLASDQSHLHWDECGAPEFFSHCKTLLLPTVDGKIDFSQLPRSLPRKGDQHYAQTKLLSLTQPTELGTCYSLSEMKSLISWAKANHLFIHIDGARLSNACWALGCTFKELTTDLGVDLVSFGGTKNGFLYGEMVLVLNPTLQKNFQWIRKQSAQLPSKSRFIAAQFLAYFDQDLWKDIATHSCTKAQKLAREIEGLPSMRVLYPVESNAVFVHFPRPWLKELRKDHFFYVWDEAQFSCRLMTSWDTKDEDLLKFIEKAKHLEVSKTTETNS
jgi:threonine aldolase